MSCCGARAPRTLDEPAAAASAAPGSDFLPWWRLVLGGVLAGNMMTLSLAINMVEPSDVPTATSRLYVHAALFAGVVGVMALLMPPLWQRLVALARTRSMDVEVLFAAAMLGALAFSLYSTCVGTGPVYYEVVALLLAIYGISQRLKIGSQQQVEKLLDAALLRGAMAQVVTKDGQVHPTPLERVSAGMVLRVHPGEPLVVDGVVVQGQASMQTLATTGEPFGRTVGVGDAVLATWTCLDASLLVRATATVGGRHVDRIGAAVQRHRDDAARSRARPTPGTQLLVQRLVRWFAPTVMLVAVATFVGWALAGNFEQALLNALAVLLVACPCALGFAVPLGLRLGVAQLARLGVEARSLAAVERMARTTRVFFDKTGTLTRVAVRLEDLVLVQRTEGADAVASLTAPQLFALAQSAQRLVAHPIAAAFTASVQGEPALWTVQRTAGFVKGGMEATCIDTEGKTRILGVGEPSVLVAQADQPRLRAAINALPPSAKPLAMCIDGALVAVVGLVERPFTEVAPLFAAFAAEHVRAEVLSGDTSERVEALDVARAAGALSAEQKAQRVADYRATGGAACFVGDGFNDTAAMASADTAVAVSDATALARALADFVVPAGRPELVLNALQCCRQTYHNVRTNVIISVIYNIVGMGLAAAGLLNPFLAAAIMLASSVTVSGRTLRLHQAKAL